MSALDGLPLLGAAGAVLSAVSGAVGAWLKGRSLTRASVAASHAKEHAASEETERAQLALVRRVTEAEARAVLAEREVTLQSARADLAEMAAGDAQAELARWRDQSNATD